MDKPEFDKNRMFLMCISPEQLDLATDVYEICGDIVVVAAWSVYDPNKYFSLTVLKVKKKDCEKHFESMKQALQFARNNTLNVLDPVIIDVCSNTQPTYPLFTTNFTSGEKKGIWSEMIEGNHIALTTRYFVYGAGLALVPEVMNRVAEILCSSLLYFVFNSTHEVSIHARNAITDDSMYDVYHAALVDVRDANKGNPRMQPLSTWIYSYNARTCRYLALPYFAE